MMNACAKNAGTAVLAALLVGLWAGNVSAALPFVTDDAGTVGKGVGQVELWYEGSSDRETVAGSEVKSYLNRPGATIGFGVAETVDLTLGFARAWGDVTVDGVRSNVVGNADYAVNAKWRFYEHSGFGFTVKPEIGYSSIVGGTDDDHATSYGGWLIATRELGAFAVSLNGGYFYNDYGSAAVRDATRSGIWSLSALLTYKVLEGLALGLDAGASTNPVKARSEMPAYALAGAIYTPARNIDLSLGFKFGITEPEPDFSGTAGVTIRF
jgi:hypothetical protein